MKQKTKEWIRELESAWSEPDGFLFKVREGSFDEEKGANLVSLLKSIKLPKEDTIDRRLVALVWYIPIFLTWQIERVVEGGGSASAFRRFSNEVHAIVEDLLGVP